MSLSNIDVAIIGLGSVADSHIRAYQELPDVRIVAVVDPRPDRTREVAERLGVPGFLSTEDLLRSVRPTIGCVLSTVASHRHITELLARAGVHVLCEKPISNVLEDAIAMREVCAAHGVQLMYGSSYRYLPAVNKAREMIAEGVIGRVRLIDERGVTGSGQANFVPMSSGHYPVGTPGGGGFGLFDHGIHLVDIFPWLLNSPIRRAMGRGNYTGRPMETEFAIVQHDCGAIGMLTYDESTVAAELPWEGLFSAGRSWIHNLGFAGHTGEWTPNASCIRIHGSKGALRLFHYANRLFLCLPGETREIEVAAGAAPEHFGRQLRCYIDALRVGQPAPLGPDVGIEALKIILAVYQSAATDRWADVHLSS